MEKQHFHLTCEHCGTELEIDPERVIKFCPFCGEKLLIDISQVFEIINTHDNNPQKLIESLPESDKKPSSPAELVKQSGNNNYDKHEESKVSDDENKKANDENDDVPVWFDPPIEKEPGWKTSLRWIFRIIVIIFPFFIAGKFVSLISPLGIFGILIIFVLVIYLAVK